MPELTSQQLSDLFRWMVDKGILGMVCAERITSIDSDEVDAICSLIEGKSSRWQDEWRKYQASLPAVGIGMNPTFQG